MGLWDFWWFLISFYLLVTWLAILFQIIVDVFRDRELGGFSKALWLIGLVIAPFLGALIYLIARGGRAAGRASAADKARAERDRSFQYAARRPSSTEQIAAAKALRDDGTISQVEFEGLKAKALAA